MRKQRSSARRGAAAASPWTPLRSEDRPGARTLWFELGGGDGSGLDAAEVRELLDEAAALDWPLRQVVVSGWHAAQGERAVDCCDAALRRGYRAWLRFAGGRPADATTRRAVHSLSRRFKLAFTLTVGLFASSAGRDAELRGAGAFAAAIDLLGWALATGVRVRVEAMAPPGRAESAARAAYQRLFDRRGLRLDAGDRDVLVLGALDSGAAEKRRSAAPSLTALSWSELQLDPAELPCAATRVVIQRGSGKPPRLLACPFILDDPRFELGETLSSAEQPVIMRHPRCASLCAAACRRRESGAPDDLRRRRHHAEVC